MSSNLSVLLQPAQPAKPFRELRLTPLPTGIPTLPWLLYRTILGTLDPPNVATVTAHSQDLWTGTLPQDFLRHGLTKPYDSVMGGPSESLAEQAPGPTVQHSAPSHIAQDVGRYNLKVLSEQSRPLPERLAAKYVEDEGSVIIVEDLLAYGSESEQTLGLELESWKLKLAKHRAAKRISLHHPESTHPMIFAIHNNLARVIETERSRGFPKPIECTKSHTGQRRGHTRPTLAPLDTGVARTYRSGDAECDSPPETPGPATPIDGFHQGLNAVIEGAKQDRAAEEGMRRKGVVCVTGSRGRTMARPSRWL